MDILPILDTLARYWPGFLAAIVLPILTGLGVLGKRWLDRVSRKATDAKTGAEAAQISINTMKTATESVLEQLEIYRLQLSSAVEQLEHYKDLWVGAKGELADMRSTLRLMEARNERVTREQAERIAANDSKIRELWEYIYAWEAAIEPEDAETQARIKARVTRSRPTNGP